MLASKPTDPTTGPPALLPLKDEQIAPTSYHRYWEELLADISVNPSLPFDHRRPEEPRQRVATEVIDMVPALVGTAGVVASNQSVSLISLWLTVTAAYLMRICQTADLVVGLTGSSPIGDYGNILPVRIRWDSLDPFFIPLIKGVDGQLRRSMAKLVVHEDVYASIPRLPGGHQWHPVRVGVSINTNTSDIEGFPSLPGNGVSRFHHDILFAIDLVSSHPTMTLAYNPELFEPPTVQRLGANLLHFCKVVISDGTPPSHAPLVCPAESRLLLEQFGRNPSATYDPLDPTAENIISAFRSAVQKYPDTTALESSSHQYTYTSLNAKMEGLARALFELGVRPEDRVAVVVENCPTTVIIMLAVWLVRAVYVPIAATLPAERQHYMAQAAGCKHVVVMADTQAIWPEAHLGKDLMAGLSDHLSLPPLTYEYHPDTPVIILFTSGTTGLPKGVLIKCSGLSNEILAPETSLCPWPGARVPQIMSVTFGGFFMNTSSTLRQGGTIVFPGEDLLSTLATVDTVTATPSLLATLDPELFPNIKMVSIGGEALLPELADRWSRRVILRNLFGPAEATMANIVSTVTYGSKITIGRPVTNTECYIVDAHHQLVPIGVTGEICLGGAGVSGGYVNRPELNDIKFVQLPFAPGRVYKTGDHGRWLPTGEVEYIGRIDDQVKIRGHRVELGEICSTLLQAPGVQDACAFVHQGRLLAFVIPASLDPTKLTTALRDTLPEYMVPNEVFCLADIPRNVNGKANRAELIAYYTQLIESSNISVAAVEWQHRSSVAQAVVEAITVALHLPSHAITPDESFIQLGGDSLSAIRFSAFLRKAGIHAPVSSIFTAPTLVQLVVELEAATDSTAALEPSLPYQPYSVLSLEPAETEAVRQAAARAASVELTDIRDILPVSSLQSGFLISTLKDPTAYMVQSVVEVKGVLDVELYRRSWEQVGRRHEALRAKFVVADPFSDHSFLQLITAQCDFEWSYHATVPGNADAVLSEYLATDGRRGFTLAGPLLRLALFRASPTSHQLCITAHHALLDAWSTSIVLAETLEAYHGAPHQARVQYHAFFEQVVSQDRTSMAQFWRSNLADAKPQPAIRFPVHSDGQTSDMQTIRFRFSPQLAAIRHYCQSVGVTLNSLLRAVWALTLARYTGSHTEVTFGVLTSGRSLPVEDIEGMVGMCINTLPLRLLIPAGGEFDTFLRQVNQASGGLMAYEQCSLVDILRWTQIPVDAPLFSTLLVYDNFNEYRPAVANPTVEYGAQTSHNTTDYAYALHFIDEGDQLAADVQFLTSHCDSSYAQLLCQFMDHCLHTVTTQSAVSLRDLAVLPEAEQGLIARWSAGPTVDFPQKDWRVHQFFTQHLATQPDAIALESATDRFTYAEVYRRACAIAATLRDRGFLTGDMAVLFFARCPDFVFSYLAVSLLGGVCVPMDIKNASARIVYMLDLVGNPWVLTTSPQQAFLVAQGASPSRMLLTNLVALSEECDDTPLEPLPPSSDALVYLVFTSGTTGRPKGVKVSNRSLTNLILAASDRFQLPSDCRWLQTINVAFDAVHVEILCTFHAGGTLVLHDGNLLDDLRRVDSCSLVSSLLAAVDADSYPNLTHIATGGDTLPPAVAKKWSSTSRLHNMYGPSEVTVASHTKSIFPGDTVTIGTPLPNTQCHILDDQLRPVPIGQPGEICICGEGVAEGYLKQPDLTAKAFIPNPFGPGRLYRTGDLGCWLANGEVQVLGRKDFQIKLRGFRIELGEIESTCQAYPGIVKAVALVKENRLVGYVTPGTVDNAGLLQFIAARLPHYMVPEVIVPLDTLPWTAIGKVDRKILQAIPLPEDQDVDDSDNLPVSETFAILRRALAEILDVDPTRVTPSASFLRLGGDSITAIQFSSRCKRYGLNLTVADILRYPIMATLEQCAELIVDQADAEHVMSPSGPVPFTAIEIQAAPSLTHVSHFNQSFLVQCRLPLTLPMICAAVRSLVVHHDVLRLRLTNVDGKWCKEVLPLPEDPSTEDFLARFASVTEESLRLDDYEGWVLRTQQSINVERGPIMACALLSVGGNQLVYLTVHHLAVDFVSWRILFEDLETLLTGGTLPQKTLPFREWSTLVNEYAQTLSDDIWPNHGETAIVPIEHDPPSRAPVTYRSVKSVQQALGLELSQLLYGQAAAQADASPEEFMVASLIMALTEHFNIASLEIDMEGHGRRPWSTTIDISRTLGWFTSIYPVTFHTGQAEHYASYPPALRPLAHVKQRLRSVPSNGFPYSLLKYLKGSVGTLRAGTTNPPPTTGVIFNYTGRFEQLTAKDAFWKQTRATDCWSHNFSLDEPMGHALSTSGIYDAEMGLILDIEFSMLLHNVETIQAVTSLWGIHLTSLIQAAVATFAPCRTPSDFPLSGLSESAFGDFTVKALPQLGMDLLEVEDIYPCLPIQEGMLLATLKDPAAYMVQSTYDIHGPLDQRRLQAAWETTFQHHATFRTRFLLGVAETAHPHLQLVSRRTDMRWTVADWSSVDTARAETEFMRTEREEGFSLDRPLVRFGLFRTGPERHRLVMSIHHAIIDGWSVGIYIQSLLRNYKGLGPQPAGRLRDLVSYIHSQDPVIAERYWTAYFDGVEQPSLLAESHYVADPTILSTDINYYGWIDRVLDSTSDLFDFTMSQGITLSTLLRAAMGIVLHRYTGLSDPIFGAIVSGRNIPVPKVKSIVGTCINTIPCRVRLSGQTTVGGLLQAVHADGTASYALEHCRVTDIHRWSGLSTEQPLFNVHFVYENYPTTQADLDLPIELQPVNSRDPMDVPLTILAAMSGNAISLRASFLAHSFSHAFVDRFLDHLSNVIHSLAARSTNESVHTVNMLSTAQLCQVAGRLTHELQQACACGPDRMIGVLADNSVKLIVGQFAAWMTGLAFVAIAPDYPAERQLLILADAACVAVVGASANLACLGVNPRIPQLVVDVESHPANTSAARVGRADVDPSSLAYVIYTSGSTGQPKGVMIEHSGLAHYLAGFHEVTTVTPTSVVPTLLVPTFDVSVSEIWTTLTSGGTVAIARPGHPGRLHAPADYPNLASVLVIGEACPASLVDKWAPYAEFINLYGPAEVTIASYHAKLKVGDPVAIGRLMPNAVVLILNEHRRLAPIGVTGHLYLGGKGLARGYLNRPDLTVERFITWPGTGERLYQSGDLARWLPDGQLECLGRIDHQVKVRGFRVELGEVEAAMESHLVVNQACILVQETHLVGYLVTEGPHTHQSILDHVRASQPNCMVLSALVDVDEFPRSRTGKIDRKALPPYDFSCSTHGYSD
ncbi:hypothetical protein IWQ60_004248 [Tieghemiomyces parasiticus]|uniref:Carrier domain-containing protein n=1 Tax=Tieghemiomyces parasiticus TaxID=78921 RepID=A0A9W8AGJ9_9FUNG|nr:hypothetical protein IWQ60_004248 [Tieghemiomyces parasiticus]